MGCFQSIDIQRRLSQNKFINSQKIIQYLQNLKSNDIYTEISNKFTQKIVPQSNDSFLSRISFWSGVIKRFDGLCLDKDQQLQLLELMFNFLKTNMQNKKELNIELFRKQMGVKFDQFQKRIINKHKMCLQYFKYVRMNTNDIRGFNSQLLRCNLNIQQTRSVAQKVRQFCTYNMQAFSFLSLYLIHSINNLHEQNQSFQSIQSELESNLRQLERIYPATMPDDKEQKNQKITIDIGYLTYQKTPKIIQLKSLPKSKYNQVKNYIVQKAKQAIDQEEYFVQLVKSICLEKGYAFKSGVKINDPLHHTAIQRTFQKLLSTPKYQSTLQNYRTQSFNVSSLSQKDKKANSKFKLKNYVDNQKKLIMEKVKEVLEDQTELQFNIKDLLRAKCMFNKIDDIQETLEKLIKKIKQQNLSVYQIKDRLKKKTKDITIIINLPNTRAQLQLALKFDKVSNEFNHKIYELIRSIKFTLITNVQIQNQKWAESFFNTQIYLFYRMLKVKNQQNFGENVTFKDLKIDVEQFIKTYLQSDFLGINLVEREEPNAQKLIERSFNQLNQILFKSIKAKN